MRFRLAFVLIALVFSACNPPVDSSSNTSGGPPVGGGNPPAGNADPFGGADFIRSLFEMSREQMASTLELIAEGYPIESVCSTRCRIGQDPLVCAYLDLSSHQQQSCQNFIATYARDLVALNRGSNRVPLSFDYDPARFRLGDREVIAMTERSSSGPVMINFLAALPFVQFPASRIALLMHEMSHKVGDYAGDSDPAQYFEDTEHRNNVVGAAIAKFWDDHDTYAEAVAADGARGYWRLNNGRGAAHAQDDSGNGWTATYQLPNRAWCHPASVPGALAGDPNRAMDFNRCYLFDAGLTENQRRAEASVHARIPNSVVAQLTNEAAPIAGLWVEFWMKWDGKGDPLFDEVSPVGFHARLLKLNANSLRFGVGAQQNWGVGIRDHDFIDRWVHVAAFFAQRLSDSRLFIDGEEKTLRTFGDIQAMRPLGEQIEQNPTFEISGLVGNDYLQFSGAIDEVAIYTTPLTPIQIRKHYELGLPRH